ncbi:MAG TPA: hypothetical protein DCS93_12750, partial [Microscillaceae bacterium]|nr:hypothetical protein [Microscillaceae bacterium]
GLVGWISGHGGKLVTSYSHQITNLDQDSTFSTPSFSVKKGKIYRVKITSGKMSNQWIAVGVNLLDDDDLVINEFETEFWHESGYDEGYWSESDYEQIIYFKATKTEKLSGEVYWIEGRGGKKVPHINAISLKINVAGTKVAANYFQLIFWVFGVLFFILMMRYGKP